MPFGSGDQIVFSREVSFQMLEYLRDVCFFRRVQYAVEMVGHQHEPIEFEAQNLLLIVHTRVQAGGWAKSVSLPAVTAVTQ